MTDFNDIHIADDAGKEKRNEREKNHTNIIQKYQSQSTRPSVVSSINN